MAENWVFPGEIRGWLSHAEGRKLAELADGKRALEIGTYEGRSAVCMAQTAASLHCIDPLDGRATKGHGGDTSEALQANLKRYRLNNVRVHAGTTAEIAPGLPPRCFDLIFIDGDHSSAAIEVDIRHALRLLAPGGLLAFHDYGSPADPCVKAAVDPLVFAGGELMEVVDTLAVVRPGRRSPSKPVVFLAQPRRGAWAAGGSAEAFYLAPTHGACEVVRSWCAGSILDHTFNRLWCAALNNRQHGITHFAMIHDDIAPAHAWLDVLLAELARTQADIISACVPIKTAEGMTSTGVETDDPWRPRRLSMAEVHALPETFTDSDVGGELLLNSGLWACDLRRPWVDQPTPLVFQTLNRIVADAEGLLQAQVRSEDWEFSRAARARGAKLCATRKVTLVHVGEQEFPSDHAWGLWQTDEVHKKRLAALGRPAA